MAAFCLLHVVRCEECLAGHVINLLDLGGVQTRISRIGRRVECHSYLLSMEHQMLLLTQISGLFRPQNNV